MLSRETCEALARAYPEIAAHEFAEGDYFYHQDGDGERPGPILNYRGFAAPGDAWCPRLDQLLDVAAEAHPPKDPNADFGLVRSGGLWCFGYMTYSGPNGPFAPTREDAVAAWLLARGKAEHRERARRLSEEARRGA